MSQPFDYLIDVQEPWEIPKNLTDIFHGGPSFYSYVPGLPQMDLNIKSFARLSFHFILIIIFNIYGRTNCKSIRS